MDNLMEVVEMGKKVEAVTVNPKTKEAIQRLRDLGFKKAGREEEAGLRLSEILTKTVGYIEIKPEMIGKFLERKAEAFRKGCKNHEKMKNPRQNGDFNDLVGYASLMGIAAAKQMARDMEQMNWERRQMMEGQLRNDAVIRTISTGTGPNPFAQFVPGAMIHMDEVENFTPPVS